MTSIQEQQTDPDLQSIGTAQEFADALSLLRNRAGRSIREVARMTGIPSATLGGYFSGRHLPPATQPQLLDQILGCLGVPDEAEVTAWHEALLRARRNPARERGPGNHASAAGDAPSPYRGLEPFHVPDAAVFFGREGIVEDLVSAVHERASDEQGTRLIMLVGPSGSGKSSVLRAGLVARLSQAPADTPSWAVQVLVPGNDPLAALGAALSRVAPADRALLVVDQAEEIFSPEVPADQRDLFIQQLAAAAAGDSEQTVVVVVGLRADFYGQAAANPRILPALRSSQFLLGSMAMDDLRRAIVEPARSVGVAVDPDLVELVVRDLTPRRGQAGYDAGALPLVSHAMLAAWARHQGNRLTVADYLAAGGIAGAVQQTAEGVVARLDDRQRVAAQWLFAQLVTVDDDGVMTRRRVSHEALEHPDPATDLALDGVIEQFVAGRLLTADGDTLEVSHEALLTAWPRLHEWVLVDLDEARMQRRISDAAAAWRERDRDPSSLLRGGPLADAQELASGPLTSRRVLGAAEEQFVAASVAQAEAEQLAERQRTKRLRSLLAVMTVLAVLAATLAGVAVQARDNARQQEQAATAARDEALSRQLAIAADGLRGTDRALGAQLALAAHEIAPTLQARSSLLGSTGVSTPTRLQGAAGEMHASANAQGTLLAVTGSDGVTRLWQRAEESTYTEAGQLPAQFGAQASYATGFSPDGDLLAVSTASGDVVLWDVGEVTTPEVFAVLDSAQSSVQSLAFSPDGTRLALGTSEPKIRLWSLPADGGQPTEARSITGEFGAMVRSVAFSPDGNTLAAGVEDGSVTLWAVPDEGRATLLSTMTYGQVGVHVHGVAFSPDGTLLAAVGRGDTVAVWDVSQPRSPRPHGEPLTGFVSWVNSVDFAPDGRTLAAGSSDGTVIEFSVADGSIERTLPHPAAVNAVQYVETGAALLTSEIDGVGHLWPVPGPRFGSFADSLWSIHSTDGSDLLAVAPGVGDGAVHLFDRTRPDAPRPLAVLDPPADGGTPDGAASMTPDGRWVAAGTTEGGVVVWERVREPAEYRVAAVLEVTDTIVQGVAISADGNFLVAAADDGAVAIWSLEAGSQPRQLHRANTPGKGLNVTFSPDSALIAVPTSDGVVHLWRVADPESGTGVEELPPLTGFDNYAYGVTFDPTGRYAAAGSTDRTVRIWDVTDPTAPVPVGQPLTGPGDTVFGLSWAPDGTLAAAVSDGKVWLWDARDPSAPRAIAALSAGDRSMYAVHVLDGGSRVLAGGSDGTVVAWTTDAAAAATQICASMGSGITEAEWQRVAPGAPFTPPCSTTTSTPTS